MHACTLQSICITDTHYRNSIVCACTSLPPPRWSSSLPIYLHVSVYIYIHKEHTCTTHACFSCTTYALFSLRPLTPPPHSHTPTHKHTHALFLSRLRARVREHFISYSHSTLFPLSFSSFHLYFLNIAHTHARACALFCSLSLILVFPLSLFLSLPFCLSRSLSLCPPLPLSIPASLTSALSPTSLAPHTVLIGIHAKWTCLTWAQSRSWFSSLHHPASCAWALGS